MFTKFLIALAKVFSLFALGFIVCFGLLYFKLDQQDKVIKDLNTKLEQKRVVVEQLVKEQQTVVVKHTECNTPTSK